MNISLTNDKKLKRLYRSTSIRKGARQVITVFLIITLVVCCGLLYCDERVIKHDLKMRKDLPDLSGAEFTWNVDTSIFETEVSAYKSSLPKDLIRELISHTCFSNPRSIKEGLALNKGNATFDINSDGIVRYNNEDVKGFDLTGEELAEKCDELMRELGLDPKNFVFDGKNSYDQVADSNVFGFSGITFGFRGDTLSSVTLSIRELTHVVTTDCRSLEDCEDYIRTDNNMRFTTGADVSAVDAIKIESAEIRYSIDRNPNHIQPLYDFSELSWEDTTAR